MLSVDVRLHVSLLDACETAAPAAQGEHAALLLAMEGHMTVELDAKLHLEPADMAARGETRGGCGHRGDARFPRLPGEFAWVVTGIKGNTSCSWCCSA